MPSFSTLLAGPAIDAILGDHMLWNYWPRPCTILHYQFPDRIILLLCPHTTAKKEKTNEKLRAKQVSQELEMAVKMTFYEWNPKQSVVYAFRQVYIYRKKSQTSAVWICIYLSLRLAAEQEVGGVAVIDRLASRGGKCDDGRRCAFKRWVGWGISIFSSSALVSFWKRDMETELLPSYGTINLSFSCSLGNACVLYSPFYLTPMASIFHCSLFACQKEYPL